jgi:hypothetical protein
MFVRAWTPDMQVMVGNVFLLHFHVKTSSISIAKTQQKKHISHIVNTVSSDLVADPVSFIGTED